MRLRWTHEIALKVGEYRDALIKRSGSHNDILVARSTGGLPVYSDLSGSLVFSMDGRVQFYDSETGRLDDLSDIRWCILATVSSVEKYPDLGAILPLRPSSAVACPDCSGTGKQIDETLFCGRCFGIGWLDPRGE